MAQAPPQYQQQFNNRGPAPGVYGPNQGQRPPQGPRPFQQSEPSWGESDEQMPWEGQ